MWNDLPRLGALLLILGTNACVAVETLEELKTELGRAMAGQTVQITAKSVIDLAGDQIVVPEKVTLAGNGALLKASPAEGAISIYLRPGARLTGARITGPNPLFKDIDSREHVPSGYAVACADAEVDHCEISQFQRGGIALFRDSERGHIHHNHLHDIAAYPVLIANGSGDGHIIEHNRIEWAWHAVGSNGSRGSGYTARHNVFVRVPRPKLFEKSGPSPPNWCLDVHENDGAETRPARPATRLLVVHDNVFRAHLDVKVGDGSELVNTNGLYPKHDIFVGPGKGLTTSIEIHHNHFLMHEKTGSKSKFFPYGRAIRVVGLLGHPDLEDDPQPAREVLKVSIHDNAFGGKDG